MTSKKTATNSNSDPKPRANKNGARLAAPHADTEMSNDMTQYVTVRPAADMLGVVPDHVYRLIEGNKAKSLRLGHEWLIYVPSIRKYLDTKSTRGRPPSRKRPTLDIK